jgi:hypothetical protein
MWFDQTGLPWSNSVAEHPEPAANTALSGFSAHRVEQRVGWSGNDTPFERVGAPGFDGRQLADALNARGIPGVAFSAAVFTPASSTYAGQSWEASRSRSPIVARLRPVRMGDRDRRRRCDGLLTPIRFDPGRTVQLLGSRGHD